MVLARPRARKDMSKRVYEWLAVPQPFPTLVDPPRGEGVDAAGCDEFDFPQHFPTMRSIQYLPGELRGRLLTLVGDSLLLVTLIIIIAC